MNFENKKRLEHQLRKLINPIVKVKIFTGKCLSICSIIASTISMANEFRATTILLVAVTRCVPGTHRFAHTICPTFIHGSSTIVYMVVVEASPSYLWCHIFFFSCHCVRVFFFIICECVKKQCAIVLMKMYKLN